LQQQPPTFNKVPRTACGSLSSDPPQLVTLSPHVRTHTRDG
jgi:hypothetical protein